MTKSGSTLTTFLDVPWDELPGKLQVNDSHPYWIQNNSRVQRRNLSTLGASSITCPKDFCYEIALGDDYIYATGYDDQDRNFPYLHRGQL